MWFRFPPGVEKITVERQNFSAEATDSSGGRYFRAPDHFAPRILGLGLGFIMVTDVPEGAPPDLPQDDPQRDGAIVRLTKELEAKDIEIKALREDFIVVQRQLQAQQTAKADLETKYARALEQIEALKEHIDDLSPDGVIPKAVAR